MLSNRPTLRRLSRVFWTAAALGLAAYAAFLLTGLGGAALEPFFSVWLQNGLLAAGAAACVARAVLVPHERRAWTVLSAGALAWVAGNVYWFAFLAEMPEPPYPSPADGLYLLFYPAAYIALVMLVRARVRHFHSSLWLDGLIGALAVTAVGAAVLFDAIVGATGGDAATVATNLAYPLADLLLLGLVAGVFALTGWRPSRSWALIGLGLALNATADVLYLHLAALDAEADSAALDGLWAASLLVTGAAAWQGHGESRVIRIDGWRTLVVPLALALVALGLLAYDHFEGLNTPATAFAFATLLAVMVRTALTFRENLRLVDSQRQAITDELTGLANRRLFYRRLSELLAPAEPAPLTVLVVDLDRFKELNDTLGHLAGDLLLEQLGPRLREALRDVELVARLGGDEFAVLLAGTADEAAATGAARRVHAALAQPFVLDGLSVQMNASLGIALCPAHGTDAESLLQRADVAMYQAKESRSGFAIYSAERDVHSRERLTLAGELRQAIDSDELVLHYQPKADLATGELVGAEALVRWNHPVHGLLAPDRFLPMAEQAGLMAPLTMRVLDRALRRCARWQRLGRPLTIAVNLAPVVLVDAEFPERVMRLLRANGVPPSSLVLEVPETAMLDNPERAVGVLRHLEGLGIGLALDDFGTGYSSLAYLARLPVKELKIDRYFAMKMGDDEADAAIVRSTVELAHRLGLTVVAEGVESQAVWEELRSLGCEVAQGFFLSRPLDERAFDDWMRRRPAATAPATPQRRGAVLAPASAG